MSTHSPSSGARSLAEMSVSPRLWTITSPALPVESLVLVTVIIWSSGTTSNSRVMLLFSATVSSAWVIRPAPKSPELMVTVRVRSPAAVLPDALPEAGAGAEPEAGVPPWPHPARSAVVIAAARIHASAFFM